MQEDELKEENRKMRDAILSLCEDEEIVKALIKRYIDLTSYYGVDWASRQMQATLAFLDVGEISVIERRIDEFLVLKKGEKWLSYDMQRGDWHRERGND